MSSASNQRDLTFPAVIRAAQSAELTFQTAGEIRELNFVESDDVKEGDVIAKLDQRNAINSVSQAEAEYRNAEAEYARAQRLVERDAISRSVLDARRTQRDIAKAALSNAEKALSDTELVAPFDGGISRVFVEQFQNIQAKEPIAVIQSSNVEAVINVPGTIVAQIPLLEPLGTTVVLDAAPDLMIQATLSEAAGQADENTQTYEVKFGFEPPTDLFILPGMTATVTSSFEFDRAASFVPSGIAVPLSSILAEGDDTYVWRVNEADMTVSKTKVQVGSDAGQSVVVTSGLSGGEQIVAAGVSFLHEGMQVRPWAPE
ncbi:MAG: efflux RND transporter periplasmic adaptor subunit [Pseudomonadota bacterium]